MHLEYEVGYGRQGGPARGRIFLDAAVGSAASAARLLLKTVGSAESLVARFLGRPVIRLVGFSSSLLEDLWKACVTDGDASPGLDVLSGQVGDAAGWGLAADAGVGSVVVVPVQPVGEGGLAFGF
jgi:hypothetical protein